MKDRVYQLVTKWADIDASWLAAELVVPLAAALLLYAREFGTDVKAIGVGYLIGIPACSLLTRLTVRSKRRHVVVAVVLTTFFVTFEVTKDRFGELSLAITPIVTLFAALVAILFVRAKNEDGTT